MSLLQAVGESEGVRDIGRRGEEAPLRDGLLPQIPPLPLIPVHYPRRIHRLLNRQIQAPRLRDPDGDKIHTEHRQQGRGPTGNPPAHIHENLRRICY